VTAKKGEVLCKGLLFLAALLPTGALAQSEQGPGQGPAQSPTTALACAYDSLTPAQRSTVAVDYSADTPDGRARVAQALAPAMANCSSRYSWDDSRRRWAGDYAGQRAEAEARAATLPAAASADRLRSLFEAMAEADRRGMSAGAEIDEAGFRAIGLRLKAAFQAAPIPPAAQGPAAGYLLAYAHLREIEAAWAALPTR
jgi:hypothetical protein